MLILLDLAYEPPLDIELPDYEKVGKALFELSHTYQIDDAPVAEIVIDEKDLHLPGWDLLTLPELGLCLRCCDNHQLLMEAPNRK